MSIYTYISLYFPPRHSLAHELTWNRLVDIILWHHRGCSSRSSSCCSPTPKLGFLFLPSPASTAILLLLFLLSPPPPLTTQDSLPQTHYSVLTTQVHYSILTIQESLLKDSRLTTQFSPIKTHHSRLTTQESLLKTHYSKLTTNQGSLLKTHYSAPQESLLTSHYSRVPTQAPPIGEDLRGAVMCA